MSTTIILGLSIFLQVTAAFLALRLIPVTGRRTAWVLIAAAFILMTFRRFVAFFRVLMGDMTYQPDAAAETIALVISVLMVAGVALIKPLFEDIRRSEARLRESEEDLRASEQRLKSVISNLPVILFGLDREGVFTLADGKGLEKSGFMTRDVLGRSVFDVCRDYPDVLSAVRKTLTGDATRGIYDVAGLTYDVSYTPLLDIQGGMSGILGVATDISERRRMEEELLKAQKLESLGILAGGIAHDFNNILTAVMGNISLARTLIRQGGPASRWLEEAERASSRAKELTNQLLTFSRGGAPVRRTISLRQLIRDGAGFALTGTNVKCEYRISDDLWSVEADEGQLTQVMNNLVINAVQAMPDGGTVTITARNVMGDDPQTLSLEEGKYVRIAVEDRGAGIPEDQLPKIFDPYFTTKQGGSGLGLAVVYSVIRNHHGNISVKSAVGEGSTFTLHLPATGTQDAVERSGGEDSLPGRGHILLMDDEEMVRRAAGEMLRALGYQVDCVKDGSEAIDKYGKALEEGFPYDAVIMDITIPGGMGGKEAIRALREKDPRVRAVVSSGYSHDPVMSNFREYGFCAVIPKPYRVADIGRVLRDLLGDKAD